MFVETSWPQRAHNFPRQFDKSFLDWNDHSCKLEGCRETEAP